jgi:hypothetical protein
MIPIRNNNTGKTVIPRNTMKIKSVILIIIGSMFLLSCMSKRHDDIMCTTEFRMLTISVKDIHSNPVILNDYFVKKTSTGEIIDFSQQDPFMDSINRIQGIYFLCTDGQMAMTSRSGTEFEFHGILDSTEIVNEKYIIGNDQCHVIMLSGQTEIVIIK